MPPVFHVFVEGPVDSAPDAVAQLADAMATRYGLPTSEIASRLVRGRFRVKSNVDRATADAYVRDLGAIGARVTIEDAGSAVGSVQTPDGSYRASRVTSDPIPNTNVRASQQIPTGRSGESLAPPTRAASMSLPPVGLVAATPAAARTTTPPSGLSAAGADARPARVSTPPSGLAAAFSGEIPLDLGALGDGKALSLASVDGADTTDAAPSATSFAPPEAGASYETEGLALPASIGPPTRPTPAPRPVAAESAPSDRFAPPDASNEAPMELTIDETPRARPSVPPANVAAISQRLPVMPRPAPSATAVKQATRELTRGRFVAGVVLAIVLGFVPAHFVAAMQERSAYAAIDRKVQQYQADPTVSEAEVESFRAGQLDAKKRKRTTIALSSMALWAAVSAAAAYVWFRRIHRAD